MNVEVLFVRTHDRQRLLDLVRDRLRSSPDPLDSQDGTPLESSYGVLLANEQKRKIAVSPDDHGWIQLVESKEVVDFALAERLSRELQADAVVVQISDVIGGAGYAHYADGLIRSRHFIEEGDDPAGEVVVYLKQLGITAEAVIFSEAVRMSREGWTIVS